MKYFPAMPEAKDNPVTEAGFELGRYLFYDPILSRNYTLSCASCHKQENAFSDGQKRFSAGNGRPTNRNTPGLFNLAWYPAYFWDGRALTLEDQAIHPVRDTNEMNLDLATAVSRINKSNFYRHLFSSAFGTAKADSVLIGKALAQFMRALISNRSQYDKAIALKYILSKDELEGFDLMNDQTKGGCLHCHTTDANALGTNLGFANNGLQDYRRGFADEGLGAISGKATDAGKFKVPSLRNVAFTAPYMHDGRFSTLEEVLDFYSSGMKMSPTIDHRLLNRQKGGQRLSSDEKGKIIAFLQTLSDTAFTREPAFSNPFKSN